jgi:hypothetical protein
MEVDLAYYRRRTAEERAAAEAALRTDVRAIHLELAAAYDQRIAELETKRSGSEIKYLAAV